MTDDYKNREIDEKHLAVMNAIGVVKGIALETKDQATKTNGRVNKLEKWRAYLAGGGAVLSAVVIMVLIPVAVSFLKSSIDINNQVSSAIEAEFRKLQIEIE